jgi:hypothetical protein
MSKKSKDAPVKPSDKLLQASYNAGRASGRIEAIEESMDAVAALVFKAEALQASLGENAAATMENARHTLQALNLAFAAITGSANGSEAFRELLEQSRARVFKDVTRH